MGCFVFKEAVWTLIIRKKKKKNQQQVWATCWNNSKTVHNSKIVPDGYYSGVWMEKVNNDVFAWELWLSMIVVWMCECVA